MIQMCDICHDFYLSEGESIYILFNNEIYDLCMTCFIYAKSNNECVARLTEEEYHKVKLLL
jgi:hypothetical protein